MHTFTDTGRRGLAILLAAIVLVAAACSADSSGSGSDEPAPSPGSSTARREVRLPDLTLVASLTPFDSCDALLGWIRAEADARVGPYGLPGSGYGPVFIADDMVEASGEVATRAGADGAADAPAPLTPDVDYSTTNTQVEGVDEPDTIKTDGEHIYSLANGSLHVVDVRDETPTEVAALPIDEAWGAELLLAGDTLLVLNREVWAVPLAGAELTRYGFAPEAPGSTLVEVDVADPANPRIVQSLTLEGYVVSARMVGDVARVVVQSQPHLGMGFVYPGFATPDAEARATEVNREVVAESTLEQWIPSFVVTDASGAVTGEGEMAACESVHQPQEFSGFGMLTVMTVDLGDGLGSVEPNANASVMSGGETVYASPEHLYVATQEYVDWEALDTQQQQAVEQEYGTAVHRFDIAGSTTTYEGSGRVDGHLLNQFAMDEHDGVLRVATTAGSPWGGDEPTSESFVTTLALDDGALVERGRVGDLGRGETIQSVRFIGDQGYVVTFRQTDPLYVVDLADPATPSVTGELKILGFSAYLHPIADGWLLGVGQDATDEGQRLGAQVSLFDVRDPANPQRFAQATLGSGSSAVEWDHRAFLWWAPEDLALVPIELYDGTPFSGAVGFTVDVDAGTVAERGRVQNRPATDGTTPSGQDEPVAIPVEPDGTSESELVEPDWVPPITRGVVVGDSLFTLSETGLLASDTATLTPQTWIGF